MSAEDNIAKSTSQLEEIGVSVNAELLDKVVKGLGIANQSLDASLVSKTDEEEVKRVVENFGMKKLGLDEATATSSTADALEKLDGFQQKQRGACYYLMTVANGKEDVYGL